MAIGGFCNQVPISDACVLRFRIILTITLAASPATAKPACRLCLTAVNEKLQSRRMVQLCASWHTCAQMKELADAMQRRCCIRLLETTSMETIFDVPTPRSHVQQFWHILLAFRAVMSQSKRGHKQRKATGARAPLKL